MKKVKEAPNILLRSPNPEDLNGETSECIIYGLVCQLQAIRRSLSLFFKKPFHDFKE